MADHVTNNKKKQAIVYAKQANKKKKLALSIKDQLKLEEAKRDNQTKTAEGWEMAKAKARDNNDSHHLQRQNKRFNVANEGA